MKKQILIALLIISLNVLFLSKTDAEMPGMDGNFQRAYAETEFGRVHYWEIGKGPTLILFHQSGQTSSEYLAMGPFLADDFRVIAIDLPNHGQSDTSDHELTMDEYADSVIDVMDDIGVDSAHMLGQHGGAYVAINLGIRYPERVGKTILSGAGRDGEMTEEKIEELLNTPMTRDLPIDIDGEFLQKTWDVYRKMSAKNTSPEVTFQPFLSSLSLRQRRYDLHYAVYRYSPDLNQFNKEALLLEAEEDIYAGDVMSLHQNIPGSLYKKVPNSGSWQFFEEPELNANIIRDFLK